MICSTTLSFSDLPPTPPPLTSSISEPKSKLLPPTSDEPGSTPEQAPRKIRTSPQLNRWSRARTVRSGRKLDRQVQKTTRPAGGGSLVRTDRINSNNKTNNSESELDGSVSLMDNEERGGFSGMEETDATATGKSIYMVSDGTGWTAEHSVNAALGQFEHCLVDRVCPVNTHLFSGIDDIDRLMEVIKQAAKEGAMVVYTLADPSMAESARQACELWGVPSADILGPITEAIASHLGVTPSGLPRWAPGRTHSLSEDYFRRIEAIEFTIKQDDGALPQNLHKADIVLAGVSRTGKTPLSIYLAQKGYKVANVPIVMNVELPSTLFEIDPEKVFALTINAVVLQTIRRARAKSLGFGDDIRSNYSEMEHVKGELEFAGRIFAQNPVWPVIEVTGKAIEETAAIVLRLFHDRKNRCSMPRISKLY